MKRFLALFAVVAIIGSMFAGVALADDGVEPAVKLELAKDEIVKGTKYVDITGYVLDADDSYTEDLKSETVYVYYNEDDDDDNPILHPVDIVSGYRFTAHVLRENVGNFEVRIGDLSADFIVKYDVTLEDELEYQLPVDDFIFVEGNALDAEEDLDVVLKYKGGEEIATGQTNDDGDFVMAFNGELELDRADDLELYIDDVLHEEGEVLAEALTVELEIPEFAEGLLDKNIQIDIDDVNSDYIDSEDEDDDTLAAGYYFTLTVEDDDEDEVVFLDAEDDEYELYPFRWVKADSQKELVVNEESEDCVLIYDDGDDLTTDDSADLNDLENGTYTVKVALYHTVGEDELKLMEGETELEVANPGSYTLTGWHAFEEVKVVSTEITLGTNLTVYKGSTPVDGYVVTYEGAGIDETVVHTLDTDDVDDNDVPNDLPSGVDADDFLTDDDGDAIQNFSLNPTHAGVISVTIDAYNVDDEEWELVKTYEKEMTVEGYSIEVNLEEVLVDEEYELTIVVTDEDGNPVNNANVYIGKGYVDLDLNDLDDEDIFQDPSSNNIISGTYTDDEWKHGTVEKLDIVVIDGTDLMASLEEAIDVVGELIFDVDADVDTLLVGNEEKVIFTITDEDGEPVFPEVIEMVDTDDGSISETYSKKDLDDDGVKDSCEVTIQVAKKAEEEIVIRVTNNANEERGEITLNVVKPEVQLTSAANLTENFKSEIAFTLVDPRDGSVIEEPETVMFEVENVDGPDKDPVTVWYNDEKDELDTFDGSATIDEEYAYFVKVSDIDWDEAEEEEVIPAVTINVTLFDGGDSVEVAELPIGEATLASTPEAMVMGTNNILTLTYTDANGNALEDYDIVLDDEEIGETDENGQIVYSATSLSTTGLTFEADTDVSDVVTECKVKSTLDMEAPVITAPAEVNVPEVVVTVTDNVRVSAVRVNGQFLTIFPLATVTEKVALVEGANTITVEAMDSNNNAAVQVLTVTYAQPVAPTPDVELQVGEATEFGTPELVNGTTMVPVRFATKLGASMEWDNATKTVTYKLGDKEISMTVGSKTAKVGEDSVTLTEAPFINAQNFTMVPLRMIAQELGFQVVWTSNDAPIGIQK